MTDALDTIYNVKRDPELTVIQDKLLRSHQTLDLLLVADVLLPVNFVFCVCFFVCFVVVVVFCCFLQSKSLVFEDVSLKFQCLKLCMSNLERDNGHHFSSSSHQFLKISKERTEMCEVKKHILLISRMKTQSLSLVTSTIKRELLYLETCRKNSILV